MTNSQNPHSESGNSPPTRGEPIAPGNRCTGIKKSGEPCRAPAFTLGPDGQLLCAMHRATPAERTEYGKRGARVTNRGKLMTRLEHAKVPQEERDALLAIPDLGSGETC